MGFGSLGLELKSWSCWSLVARNLSHTHTHRVDTVAMTNLVIACKCLFQDLSSNVDTSKNVEHWTFIYMFNIFHRCSTFFTSVQHFFPRWLTSLNIFPILVQSGLTILLWTVLKQKIVWTRTHTSCLCMHRQHFQICSLNVLYRTTFSYFCFKIDIFVNIWFAPRGPWFGVAVLNHSFIFFK